MDQTGTARPQSGHQATARAHLVAAQLVAKQLAVRVTRAGVQTWAYHMKMMLGAKV